MKRILLLLLISMFVLTSSIAQEKWDSDNCIYTNHTYNFHWILPSDLEWEKVMPNEKHSVFKATSSYGMFVFVNVNKWNTGETAPDLWDNFDKYKQLYAYSWEKVKERTGGEITPLVVEECRFGGERAIKLIVKQELKDDVVNETSYGVTYNLHKDRCTWSVSLKCSEAIWNLLSEDDIKAIMAGFGFNAKEL